MQNFMSNMMPGGGQNGAQPDDGVPWWMKYAGKVAGIVAGIAAILFGVMCCISLSPMCIVAGVWQCIAGFIVILIEAPFCCMFLDFVQQFSGMVEGRPVWQKAALYLIISIPAIFLCFTPTAIAGSGAIFLTAVFYGMMSMGRKASREEMMTNAAGAGAPTPTIKPATGPMEPQAGMKAGLTGNIVGQDVEAAKGVY